MKPSRLVRGVLVMLVGWPVFASADPISFFYDSRNAVVFAHVHDSSGDDYPSASAYQGNDLHPVVSASTGTSMAQSSAGLVSDLSDPTHLWGRGTATMSYETMELADVYASSTYLVGLHLERPYTFSVTAQGSSTGRTAWTETGPNAQAGWGVQLRQTGGGVYLIDDWSNDPGEFTHAGTLLPGDWYLTVQGNALGATGVGGLRAAASQFQFAMNLAPAQSPLPTPEPASMLLLGTGLAGAFAARRRR